MKQKIINMTPHDVNILNSNDEIVKTYPKSDETFRLVEHIENVAVIDGCLITKTTYSEPNNLPEEQAGVYYIVSQMVKNNLPHRSDLLVPTNIKRDASAVVIGARALGI